MNPEPTAPTTAKRKRKPGRPRQERPSEAYLARQSEIVDVAIEVFRERGFDSGSLDDVAAALGTGRASLYHYVPSKAHLLYLVFDRAISTTVARMEELAATIEDPTDRLRSLMRELIFTIAADPSLFIVFFGDRPALDDKYESEILPKERRVLRLIIEAVADAGRQGSIPVTEPRLAAQAILGMVSWLHKWYDPARDQPEAFAQTCEDLIFRTNPLR